MINAWKLGFKSLRYAYGRRSTIIMMGIFFAMGLAFSVMWLNPVNSYLGGYMLIVVAILPTQMVYSLSVSNMVQASPAKKKMQTSIPAIFTCGNLIGVYLLIVLIQGAIAWGQPVAVRQMKVGVLMSALTILVVAVYLAVAYKHFIISILMFILFYFSMFQVSGLISWMFLESAPWSYPLVSVMGLVPVILGGFLQYLVSLLVYKAPMSKMANSALRKEL